VLGAECEGLTPYELALLNDYGNPVTDDTWLQKQDDKWLLKLLRDEMKAVKGNAIMASAQDALGRWSRISLQKIGCLTPSDALRGAMRKSGDSRWEMELLGKYNDGGRRW